MPIYEFRCPDCGTEFEKIVFTSDCAIRIACPNCDSERVQKLMSVFAGGGKTVSGCSSCSSSSCASCGS
ncbi:MAG: zinc ribbon domain-containing protein [Syntrophales bacterium]|nr:zinc ribbon domain-containing protein [Syntrophales bacterium]